jgi:hypothetical protein
VGGCCGVSDGSVDRFVIPVGKAQRTGQPVRFGYKLIPAATAAREQVSGFVRAILKERGNSVVVKALGFRFTIRALCLALTKYLDEHGLPVALREPGRNKRVVAKKYCIRFVTNNAWVTDYPAVRHDVSFLAPVEPRALSAAHRLRGMSVPVPTA